MRYPLLYQLNTRVLLGEVGKKLGRRASFQDLSDEFLDEVRDNGFQWLWPLGVWQTGRVARERSRTNPGLREGYARSLPDWRDEDVCGSPFAVQRYEVHVDFGGNEALAALPRTTGTPEPEAAAGFRAQSRRARPPLGRPAPRVLHRGHARTTCSASRTTGVGSPPRRDPGCWRTVAIRTFPAGPTRSS